MVYWLFYVKGMTFPLRAGMTMVHGNPWTPGIWQMVISAFLFSAQMPVTALRIKHFRKAGTKNEHEKQKGRQELAETGGRIPVQGYRCPESQ
ncbi:hypothetical protein [Faecalibaculum rodentium]|uniref:hypothetical protein n=1 Tax=Faecalibaculum rodentium TaxID=1702221 RepID=UPI0025A165FA|nr:hypothetical protein [Faecalibaculum rodentium]